MKGGSFLHLLAILQKHAKLELHATTRTLPFFVAAHVNAWVGKIHHHPRRDSPYPIPSSSY
jgi:hypothetical protein